MRLAARLLLAFLALPLLWLLAAASAALLPHAGDYGVPDGEITIAVVSNGYHASLIVPVSAGGVNWRATFSPADTRAGDVDHEWLMLGWGDRDFYMETRTVRDVRPGPLFRALAGQGESALHVVWLPGFQIFDNARVLRLSPARYQRLAAFVAATLRPDRAGGARLYPGRGYGPGDAFYEAKGSFSVFYTCNEWVAEALRRAGIAAPRWAPLPQLLLWSLIKRQ